MQYILCLSENLYKNFEPMNLKNILIITFVVYLKKKMYHCQSRIVFRVASVFKLTVSVKNVNQVKVLSVLVRLK